MSSPSTRYDQHVHCWACPSAASAGVCGWVHGVVSWWWWWPWLGQVAFDATGKLVAVRVSAQLNGGFDADISGFATWAFTHSVDQAYYAPHFDTSGEYLHTNTLTRTAARGPGDAQSAYVMETILDHVASASGA